MAIITTNTNLSSLTITAGEQIEIRNGATLTVDTTPSILPGNILCTTSGKLRIENSSTNTPICVPLLDMNKDFRFEGNGVMEVRGQMMEIGTGTGSTQSFNFTTLYSGEIKDITYVEVETTSGSGEYTPWGIIPIDPIFFNVGRTDGGGAQSEFVGTPYEAGKVAFWHYSNKTLSFGDNTNGWSVPTGCKIRIPNILITNNYATDATLVHAIISEGTPTGGTFTITIRNRATGATLGTTSAIAFNATAATIGTAIVAITGAGTVTSSGGALPTIVTITWAGSLASTPLALTVNSSVTGGTSSVIYTRENSAANLTLIDLNPSGTLDAENCMFSQKIRIANDAWSRARLVGVGLGSDLFTFNNSNGDFELDKVSFTASPYVQGSACGLTNVLGQGSINKIVLTHRRSATNFTVSAVPSITKLDNVKFISYYATARSASNRATLNFATLSQNLVIDNAVSVGGRLLATNLFNTIWNNTKVADNVRSTQDTGNAVSAIQMSNCVNQTFLNTGMAGIGAQRNYFFAPDINSSNIEVINANLNAGNNTFGLVQPNGKTTKFKNSNIANIRSGPFIDQPTTFTASGIEARKVFNTYATAQSTSGLDVAQDGVYDLLSSGIAGITETFASVENYVGGNFTDVSLTPTTGHVTFGPIGRGVGYTATGSTYTSQTGFAKLETSGDTMELEIPFAMHGITSFQNVSPLLFVDAQGAIANNHAVFNQSGVTGGTFTITVKDSSGTSLGTTPAQAFNVTAANLQVAIRALNASINLSVVSGSLSSGFAITLTGTAAYFGIVEVNGALLTGGTDPATAYAVGRPRLLTGEAFGSGLSCDFAVKTPSGSYGTYQSLTASNLSTAISGLSGYDAGTGLHMKVKLTSNSTNPYNSIWQISMPTNIDTSLWTVYDAYINLLNVNPTDIVELRRVSDNTVIQSWTGGGVKEFTVVGDFARQAYFVRKTSGGTILKSTVATPITLTVNDNGSADLKESLVSVAGVLSTETCEMRLESTDAVVYTRTGSGNFTLFDTDIATVVYFVRLSGGIVVSSSKATPKTLTIGNNGTVNLFTGDEVQLAQAPELVEINTNLPKVNRNVIKASKLIPAGETF